MWPRTLALVSYMRDGLSLMDPLSLIYKYLGEMGEMSFDFLTMVQDDRAALPVDKLDEGIAGSVYGRADGSRYVQSGMELQSPRYWGRPHSYARYDASLDGPLGRERRDHLLELVIESNKDAL